MNPATMYHVIQSYLERIPGAIKEMAAPDATTWKQRIFTPQSLRATTATLLLEAGTGSSRAPTHHNDADL